jgi:hypothetical protein
VDYIFAFGKPQGGSSRRPLPPNQAMTAGVTIIVSGSETRDYGVSGIHACTVS